jgi:predicted flap endonuclease-1-like 5' DNA nuclease
MSYNIEKIEGIGADYAAKLAAVGITTTDDLLARCGAKKGREGVSRESGVDEKKLLEWTNRADLMRINGVGEEYSDLLEHAGVDTVKELATRNAENLTEAMAKENETTKHGHVNKLPSVDTVQGWIDQAKKMDPMVSH